MRNVNIMPLVSTGHSQQPDKCHAWVNSSTQSITNYNTLCFCNVVEDGRSTVAEVDVEERVYCVVIVPDC